MSQPSSKGVWSKAPSIQPNGTSSPVINPSATPSSSSSSPALDLTAANTAASANSSGSAAFAGLAAALTSSVSPSHSDLYNQILSTGNLVSLSLPTGESVKGVVFCFDPTANQLALEIGEANSRQFSLINSRLISNVQLIKSNHSPAMKLPEISREKLAAREQKSIEERKQDALKIGRSVSADAQRLFDAIVKTYECRWDDTTIVVMDSIRISSPYNSSSISGSNAKQVERIKKVLEAERSKCGMKN